MPLLKEIYDFWNRALNEVCTEVPDFLELLCRSEDALKRALSDDLCDHYTVSAEVNDKLKGHYALENGSFRCCLLANYGLGLDYVLKFNHWIDKYGDSCKEEVAVYNAACDEGVEGFFGECFSIGTFSIMGRETMECFVMRRADVDEDRVESAPPLSEEETEKYCDSSRIFTDVGAFKTFLDYYGDKVLQILIDFLRRLRIGDIHEYNIGYTSCGAPIIIDYSYVF